MNRLLALSLVGVQLIACATTSGGPCGNQSVENAITLERDVTRTVASAAPPQNQLSPVVPGFVARGGATWNSPTGSRDLATSFDVGASAGWAGNDARYDVGIEIRAGLDAPGVGTRLHHRGEREVGSWLFRYDLAAGLDRVTLSWAAVDRRTETDCSDEGCITNIRDTFPVGRTMHASPAGLAGVSVGHPLGRGIAAFGVGANTVAGTSSHESTRAEMLDYGGCSDGELYVAMLDPYPAPVAGVTFNAGYVYRVKRTEAGISLFAVVPAVPTQSFVGVSVWSGVIVPPESIP